MSLYNASVPQLKKMLNNLDRWLDTAVDYAQKKPFDPQVLLTARLAPDQYALTRQIQAACDAADRAVQTHGGNGITQEYGMAGLLVATRAGRIAPVSREMILNFVAMHSLGLPKSY